MNIGDVISICIGDTTINGEIFALSSEAMVINVNGQKILLNVIKHNNEPIKYEINEIDEDGRQKLFD